MQNSAEQPAAVNCADCLYRQEDWRDGGHCYMFEKLPVGACCQFRPVTVENAAIADEFLELATGFNQQAETTAERLEISRIFGKTRQMWELRGDLAALLVLFQRRLLELETKVKGDS